jgi:hypothetical protein
MVQPSKENAEISYFLSSILSFGLLLLLLLFSHSKTGNLISWLLLLTLLANNADMIPDMSNINMAIITAPTFPNFVVLVNVLEKPVFLETRNVFSIIHQYNVYHLVTIQPIKL